MNFKIFLAGFAILILGVFFYVTARPPNSVYFLTIIPFHENLYPAFSLPVNFGRIGNILPAFIHILGFILISSSIMELSKKRDILNICLAWLFIAWIFEIGQNFPDEIVKYIPAWFEKFPFLENFEPYFKTGRFDILDLVAAGIGAAVAYTVLLTIRAREREGR